LCVTKIMSEEQSNNKLAFSLGGKKKKKANAISTTNTASKEFDSQVPKQEEEVNNDLPKELLVIPVQADGRKSLQEQARQRREHQLESEQQQQQQQQQSSSPKTKTNQEDLAAIQALEEEATEGGSSGTSKTSKMVIDSNENTFQRDKGDADDKKQFQNDLEKLATDLSVESEAYRKVPIQDFGAALLRGMGWTGAQSTAEDDKMNMPRPSKLGLGAAPKLLDDAPTHGNRRPRRQDQVHRDERLKQQQEEYHQKQQEQLKLDKQRTLQIGSIVWHDRRRRAIMRQLQGVPGLNMVLIHFEEDDQPTKVKKGEIELIERSELEARPFKEPPLPSRKEESSRSSNNERSHRDDNEGRPKSREENDRRRRHSEREEEGDRHRRQSDRGDDDGDDRRHRSDRDDRRSRDDASDRRDRHREEDRRRKRREEESSSSKRPRYSEKPPTTWVIPNIRVRIVTAKLGKSHYKQKGVVVDVTHKGTATLQLDDNQVLQVPERYLETALPKVGGSAIVLTGENRLTKGRLLERDSRSCKGVIQVFEDMNVLTLSLDDLAEWCGSLDDDLLE
jgi:hypothetical protein